MTLPIQSAAEIAIACTEEDIRRCFPVMAELRAHLTEAAFVAQVQRQQRDSRYHLAALAQDSVVQAVAGYRFSEHLAWGRILYVDDLVTASAHRSQGYGETLFEWLREQARAAGCGELHLDSGVQRFGAHRFYLNQRMDISCHHFALKIA